MFDAAAACPKPKLPEDSKGNNESLKTSAVTLPC